MTESVLITFIIAFATAGLSNILQFTFREGQIFSFYLPWVAKNLSKPLDEPLNSWLKTCDSGEKECIDETYKEYAFHYIPIYKTLGGCGTCFNLALSALIGFLFIVIFSIFYKSFEVYLLLALPFISSYWYRSLDFKEKIVSYINEQKK